MAILTTVIPTYRRAAVLKGAIESVLSQTFEDLRVEIYDDASGDETPEIVRSISSRDSRVRYFCHQERLGMMANFSYGVGHVTTPYFHIMSDDDLLLPDFFRIGVEQLERYPEAMLFVGRLIMAQPNGDVSYVTGETWKAGLEYPPDTFLKMTDGHTWTSMIFRRDVLATVGRVDPYAGPAGDQDFELRVTARHAAVVSEALCAIFCLHPNSNSVSDPLAPLLRGIPGVVRNVEKILDEGVRDGLIAHDANESMRAAMLAGLSRQLTTSALVAASQGRRESLNAAARLLAQTAGNSGWGCLLRALALPVVPQALISGTYRVTRFGRRRWRNRKYAELRTLVENAFLRAQTGAGALRWDSGSSR